MMKNEIKNYKIKEDEYTNYSSFSHSEYLVKDSFLFILKRKEEVSFVSGEAPRFASTMLDIINSLHEREQIYIAAIENLLKQKKYLNLLYELEHDYISEEDFDTELEVNESSYLINVNKKLDNKLFQNMITVLTKLNHNFDDDDLSEIFSLEGESFVEVLHNNKILK